jgi:hypothetical protein
MGQGMNVVIWRISYHLVVSNIFLPLPFTVMAIVVAVAILGLEGVSLVRHRPCGFSIDSPVERCAAAFLATLVGSSD